MCDDKCIFKFIPFRESQSHTFRRRSVAVASCLALFLEHLATSYAFLRQRVNLKRSMQERVLCKHSLRHLVEPKWDSYTVSLITICHKGVGLPSSHLPSGSTVPLGSSSGATLSQSAPSRRLPSSSTMWSLSSSSESDWPSSTWL